MLIRWIGAGLILLASGAYGFSIACNYRKEEDLLRSLLHALGWMERELRYHLTPLPELCSQTARQAKGPIRRILNDLGQLLQQNSAADAAECMVIALNQCRDLSPGMKQLFYLLGSSLGSFDLTGQLDGIKEVRTACCEELNALCQGKEQRLRSYQTLSLCAGAALVILLI